MFFYLSIIIAVVWTVIGTVTYKTNRVPGLLLHTAIFFAVSFAADMCVTAYFVHLNKQDNSLVSAVAPLFVSYIPTSIGFMTSLIINFIRYLKSVKSPKSQEKAAATDLL